MHAATVASTPIDPIRSLVRSMHDDEVIRVYRQLENRIEKVAEWFADTAADVDTVRDKFGVGRYVVRVLTMRKKQQLVIRKSIVVNVMRFEAEVAS